MAKVGYRKIEKAFDIDYNGHIISCEVGKFIMALPDCDTDTEFMVAYELSPFSMPKEYFSDKLYEKDKAMSESNYEYSNFI